MVGKEERSIDHNIVNTNTKKKIIFNDEIILKYRRTYRGFTDFSNKWKNKWKKIERGGIEPEAL